MRQNALWYTVQDQAAELLRQRILCGWNQTPAFVAGLRDAMDAGLKAVFWITLPPPASPTTSPTSDKDHQTPTATTTTTTTTTTTACSQHPKHQVLRIGHVSLDSIASPEDLTLANPHDKSVLTIANLFVLPAHRGGGVARAAVDLLTTTVAKNATWGGSPHCRTVAVTTLSKKYHDDDAWRARFRWLNGLEESESESEAESEAKSQGGKRDDALAPPGPERGRSNEDWYVRMGFVKWKEEPRYPSEVPGREGEKFVASFLRKEI